MTTSRFLFCRRAGSYLVAIAAFLGLSLCVLVVLDDASHKHRHVDHLPEHLRPFRPLGIRILNAVGGVFDRFGLLETILPLSPDKLLLAACYGMINNATHPCVLLENHDDTRTSLQHFNNDRWHEGFRRLTSALSKADLTFLGRIVARGQVIAMLETRGHLLEAFEEDSKSDAAANLSSQPLHDPVFVLGLPRTGTTLLSRLLALDPSNRAPTMWEYMDPVPRPPHPPPSNATASEVKAYEKLTNHRVNYQKHLLDQYKSLAPGLDALHPMDPTFPEECIIIMNMAMDSEQVAITYPIHEYMEWLLEMEHHRDVLKWNKRVLQHLQQDDSYGPRRWILKTPYYLTMMDDIRKIHPNAKIVHTHREPNESIPSTSSLIAKVHSIVTDDIDLNRIGAQQAKMHEIMLDKAMTVRTQWAAEETNQSSSNKSEDNPSSFAIVDVQLQDLQRDPIATIDKIYRALFDTPLDPSVAATMTEWLKRNPRKPHGIQRPIPSDFGLEETLRDSPVYSKYRDLYSTKKATAYEETHNNDNDKTHSSTQNPPPNEL